MRGVKIFSGRSHPLLSEAICQRLGTSPAKCDLGNFANGETSVQMNTSIRNEDVFIVQSGSERMNDSVMELLIMIAACKGGSAKSITAVMPYFPYARSSKKKYHRGAITAKMVANLLSVAGVDHVITVDLHANQMQGFFQVPVDNLFSEAIFARWIKANVSSWRDAVVVSKNVGGSKRVTSLADALKLSFAIVSTDRTRTPHYQANMMDSVVFFDAIEPQAVRTHHIRRDDHFGVDADADADADAATDRDAAASARSKAARQDRRKKPSDILDQPASDSGAGTGRSVRPRNVTIASSPLVHTMRQESVSPARSTTSDELRRIETAPPNARRPSEWEVQSGFHDEKARDVVVGRLVHGHIVDDDHQYYSPALSGMSASVFGFDRGSSDALALDDAQLDPMASSIISLTSLHTDGHALGGTIDASPSSEDEEDEIQNPDVEHTVTLVGNVKDRTVFIMDDIMDRSGSWIAAAETCVKRGGANRVYCLGIHALLGDEALEEMEACDCIDHIVVTNTFPIDPHKFHRSKKLVVIDMSNLLSEAIRRNHHGESMSTLFFQD